MTDAGARALERRVLRETSLLSPLTESGRSSPPRGGTTRRRTGLIVAVSGGADSVALLAILASCNERLGELGAELSAAHVHHHLRGTEADRHAAFVARLCARLGVPFHLLHAEASRFRAASGVSLEHAARSVRYRALAELAAQIGAASIATAHTLDDQAETVMLRLLAGAGTSGLAGIRAALRFAADSTAPAVWVLRPCLGTERATLREYLRFRHLTFRRDSSNTDLGISRNRLRKRVMPVLAAFQPGAVQRLARVAIVMQGADAHFDSEAREWLQRHATGESDVLRLPIRALGDAPAPVAKRALDLAVSQAASPAPFFQGLSFRQFELASRLWSPGSRARQVALPLGLVLEKEGDSLSLSRRAARIPVAFRYTMGPGDMEDTLRLAESGVSLRGQLVSGDLRDLLASVCSDSRKALLALGEGSALPAFEIRSRRPGDRFWPLGAKGPQRLKSFLIGRKVPSRERGRLPLVIIGEEIAWVGGEEIAEPFRVNARTRRALFLELIP